MAFRLALLGPSGPQILEDVLPGLQVFFAEQLDLPLVDVVRINATQVLESGGVTAFDRTEARAAVSNLQAQLETHGSPERPGSRHCQSDRQPVISTPSSHGRPPPPPQHAAS